MTIPEFEIDLGGIPGAALGKLWAYCKWVLEMLIQNLSPDSDFYIYQSSDVLECVEMSQNNILLWLDLYLDSVTKDPACLDITTFHLTLSTHILPPGTSSDYCKHCKSIPGETICKFWTALMAVFRESIRKAGSDFSLTQKSTLETTGALPLPEGLNMQGADVILQSSDLISFCVHTLTMAILSPFFSDLVTNLETWVVTWASKTGLHWPSLM
ncbi:hypothetical protein EDB92DRAFT_1862887 [Lactarius akahatsu]|uniref:Uncharacterized protein n=1 Tax=Lactarius akahatsu TaxID=416441 RepID=A0AAD4LKI8_9AGAM|nr:hypothetical protein EDB92DRAFT_1862887 [Lactarius akahatsu]